jgi:hypothetical protein
MTTVADTSFKEELRKLFYIYIWHKLTSSSFTIKNVFVAFCRVIEGVVLPLWAVILTKKPFGWYLLIGWLLIITINRRNVLSPENLKIIHVGYRERKGKFSRAIWLLCKYFATETQLNDADKQQIRGIGLDLIVSYVRGHRSDLENIKIFASLMVEEGENLVVMHRDSDSNENLDAGPYLKKNMLAWRAMQESTPRVSGNIQKDFPGTPSGKRYKSVLCLPVLTDDKADPTKTVAVGVVSVVSSEPYHFDTHENDLDTRLMPYMRLIALALS